MKHAMAALVNGPGLVVTLQLIAGCLALGLRPAEGMGRRRRWIAGLSFLSAFLAVAPSLFVTPALLRRPLLSLAEGERQAARASGCLNSFSTLVVLGGGLRSRESASPAGEERARAAGRFLADHRQVSAVILSGGPTLRGAGMTEAGMAERDMRRELGGIDLRGVNFYREEDSLNTHDNAVHSRALVDRLQLGASVILLTGVAHIPRAARTFAAQGFIVCAFPVEDMDLSPPSRLAYDNASLTALLLTEHVGRWAYEWRGWIR